MSEIQTGVLDYFESKVSGLSSWLAGNQDLYWKFP